MSEYGEPEGKEPAREPLRFDDELRRCLSAEPFHDVEILTTAGDRFRVTDRMQVALGATVVVVVRDGYGVRIIRKNQIVSIDVVEPAA